MANDRSLRLFLPVVLAVLASLPILLLEIKVASAQNATGVCPFNWSKNLKIGSKDEDVLKLQRFLNSSMDTVVSTTGAGSAGNESNVYGPATARAVAKFQQKYANDILVPNGLKKGNGIMGISTRTKMNNLCSSSPVANSTVQDSAETAAAVSALPTPADTLTISDPGQPASSIAPAGAGVLFLEFTLSAGSKDVTVQEITVERTGLGMDGAFASLGLWDEQGLQIGNVVSFNSAHQAVFRTPFKIPAGKTQSFQIYANMAADLSSYDTQTPAIQIVGIKASSPVEGALPLRGSAQKINNSLVVGGATATLSQFDPSTARTRYINDTGVKFSGIRITANSQEDITLTNIIWTQSGTAGAGDIANIATIANGNVSPAFISPYSNREYVSVFNPGVVIKKGESIDVYVQGDLTTSGSSRTVEFDIRDINDEVSLTGNQYGFGVGLSPAGNTDVAGAHSAFITSDGTTDGDTGTPFFAGSITTISGAGVNYVGKN